MSDIVLTFGGDLSDLRAEFAQAQREIAQEIRRLERSVGASLRSINTELGKAGKQVSSFANTANKSDTKAFSASLQQGSAALEDFSADAKTAATDAESTGARVSKAFSDIGGAASKIQGSLAPLSNIAAVFLAAEASVTGFAIKLGKDAFAGATDFESALLDVQKVVPDNTALLALLGEGAFQLSNQFGVASTAALRAAGTFIQAGQSATDAFELTKEALILTNIGDGIRSVEQGASILRRIIAGFRTDVSAIPEIVDTINAVSNRFNVTFGTLAESFADFSPIAKIAGFSIRDTAAILTSALQVFGDAGETSTAFRTILLRLASDTKQVTDALADLNVATRDSTGAAKPALQIYKDTALALSFLSKEEQLRAANQIAGKQQADQFVQAIRSYGDTLAIINPSFVTHNSRLEELRARLKGAEFQANVARESLRNLSIVAGGEYSDALTGAIRATGLIARTLQSEIQSGGANVIFSELNRNFEGIENSLLTINKVLPGALNSADLSGFAAAIQTILGRFGNLQITSTGAATAITATGKALAAGAEVAVGIRTAFAGAVGVVLQLVRAFTFLDPVLQRLVGVALGVSFVLRNVRIAALALAAVAALLSPLGIVVAGILGSAIALSPTATAALSDFAGSQGLGGVLEALSRLTGLQGVLAGLNLGSVDIDLSGLGEQLKQGVNSALAGSEGTLKAIGNQIAAALTSGLESVEPVLREIGRLAGEVAAGLLQTIAGINFGGADSGLQQLAQSLSTVRISAADIQSFLQETGSVLIALGRFALGAIGGLVELARLINRLGPEAQFLAGAFTSVVIVLGPLAGAIGAILFLGAGLLRFRVALLGVGATAAGVRTAAGAATTLGRSLSFLGRASIIGAITALVIELAKLADLQDSFSFSDAAFLLPSILVAINEQKEFNKLKEDHISLNAAARQSATSGVAGIGASLVNSLTRTNDAIDAQVSSLRQLAPLIATQANNSDNAAAANLQVAATTTAAVEATRARVQVTKDLSAALTDAEASGSISTALFDAEETERNAGLILKIQNDISKEQERIIFLNTQLEAEAEQKKVALALQTQQVKIQAAQDALTASRARLQELVNNERQAADDIKRLRESIASIGLGAEFEAEDIRRRGLADRQQQAALASSAANAEARAILQLLQLKRDISTEEKRQALERASDLAQRARSLASQLSDTARAARAVESLGALQQRIIGAEIELRKESAEAAKAAIPSARAAIKAQEEDLKGLKAGIEGIVRQPILVQIETNADKIADSLGVLKARFDALPPDLQIQVRESFLAAVADLEKLQKEIQETKLAPPIELAPEANTAPAINELVKLEKKGVEVAAKVSSLGGKIKLDTTEAVISAETLGAAVAEVERNPLITYDSNVEDQTREINNFNNLVRGIDKRIQFLLNSNIPDEINLARVLERQLNIIRNTTTPVDLVTNQESISRKLELIQKQLNQLARGVTIPIRTQGGLPGANVGTGFNRGGVIPGGGADRDSITAFLTPGEFVLRRKAVSATGQTLLRQLNSVTNPAQVISVTANFLKKVAPQIINFDALKKTALPATPIIANRNPPLLAFNAGGAVTSTSRGKEVPIVFNIGSSQIQLKGEPSEAKKLADELTRLGRLRP